MQLHFQWLQVGPLSQSISWEQALHSKYWDTCNSSPCWCFFSQTSSSLFSMRSSCIQVHSHYSSGNLDQKYVFHHIGPCCVCVIGQQLVKKPSFIFLQKSRGFQLLFQCQGLFSDVVPWLCHLLAQKSVMGTIVAASLATHSEDLQMGNHPFFFIKYTKVCGSTLQGHLKV